MLHELQSYCTLPSSRALALYRLSAYKMKIFTKRRLILALGLVLAAAATAAYLHSKKDKPIPDSKFRSAVVDNGNITQTVTATGTINPVALINVGSQVSGTVVELKADFND